MRFFLDNCLSPRYAQALHHLSERDGHKVAHLQDKFARDSPDQRWILGLKEEGDWTIVSGDTRILRSPQLKAEWLASGLTAFFLASGWMKVSYWNQVGHLVSWWPLMLQAAEIMEPGTGFEVPFRRPGQLKVLRAR